MSSKGGATVSHSTLTRSVMKWVRRHPLAAGLALWLVGMAVGWQSFDEGAQHVRFAEGSAITGEVRAITRVAGAVLPRYKMQVRWDDAAGDLHQTWTQAHRSDLRRYSIGDSVELRLAADGSGAVITERLLRSRGVLRIGGMVATPLLWAALALMLGGAFLVATRERFLGEDS
ncbi:MAG: hypothetical protein ABL977_14430 [Candidatus Eisenbacteria bacterium]